MPGINNYAVRRYEERTIRSARRFGNPRRSYRSSYAPSKTRGRRRRSVAGRRVRRPRKRLSPRVWYKRRVSRVRRNRNGRIVRRTMRRPLAKTFASRLKRRTTFRKVARRVVKKQQATRARLGLAKYRAERDWHVQSLGLA